MTETPRNQDHDDDILDLACGELDPLRRAEVEAGIAADPDRAAEAKGLAEALEAARRVEAISPAPDFNARLRQRLESEAGRAAPTAGPSFRARSWIRRLAVPSSIAAALLLGLLLGSILPGGRLAPAGGKIAWADVVQAMSRIPYCHAVVLEEDRDESFWLEYHFRRPGLWRAHGFDRVQFYSEGKVRTFDAREKKFIEDLGGRRGPLPPEQVLDEVVRDDFLTGILKTLFRGNIPPGEPVRSSMEARGGDMEVFDHAIDPKAGWLRIWVLKASRLPVRLELNEPESDDRMLVVLDYSDPQAEDFFDPAKFEAEARGKYFRSPRQYYRVGQRPVGEKPRGPEQIHEMQGYRFPRLLEIEAREDGDILIAAEDPRNMSPSGSRVEGEYCEELFDKWGNLYLRYYRRRTGSPGTLRQHYMPLPPKREGQGKQVLTLRYAVWDFEGGAGYDRIVGEEKVEVPRPAAEGALDPWLKDENSRNPFWKQQAVLGYFARSNLTHGQMEFIEGELAREPDSVYFLQAKYRLLEQLGDEAAAAPIRDRLRDQGLAGPFERPETDSALADHLKDLCRADRLEEFWQIVEKLEAARDSLLGSGKRDAKGRIKSSPLHPFLEARQGLEELKKLPGPEVEQIASSEDGRVHMVLFLPDTGRKTEFSGTPWLSGGSASLKPGSAWKAEGSLLKDRKLFLKFRGKGDRLELVLDPLVVTRERSLWELRLPWTVAVQVPAPSARALEDLEALFPEWTRMEKDPAAPAIYEEIGKAYKLFSSGQYEEALAAYRRILERPKADWPRPTGKEDLDGFLQEQNILVNRLQAARCLVQLDRTVEARALLAEIEAGVRKTPEFSGAELSKKLEEVFHARLAIPERLLERGLLDEAQAELDGIGRSIPDFRVLDNLHRLSKVPHGATWVQERKEAASPWRHFDRLLWKLKKLREKSTGASSGAAGRPGGN